MKPQKHPEPAAESDVLLTVRDVQHLLRISNPTLSRIRADESAGFPKPIAVTAKAVRWRRSDVEDWLERRKVD